MPAKSLVANSTQGKSDDALVINRVFDAPRKLVFQAWTQPKHLTHWCAPHGFQVTHCNGDFREGGAWRSCMRSPEGEDLWLGGKYCEIVPNEWLIMTHMWDADEYGPAHETLITLGFSDYENGKTLMVFRQENFCSPSSREGHAGGWQDAFERLSDYVREMNVASKGE